LIWFVSQKGRKPTLEKNNTRFRWGTVLLTEKGCEVLSGISEERERHNHLDPGGLTNCQISVKKKMHQGT